MVFFLLPLAIVLATEVNGKAGTGGAGYSPEELPNRNDENGVMVLEPILSSRIYITEAGKEHSQSVVLVHGLGDLASDTWAKLIPQLARKYHVVAFDLPGFGRSEKKNELYSPTNYAAVTKWVVDNYVPGKFHLVGHSLGGAVALRFAANYPARLEKLVLVDAAGILHRAAITKSFLRPGLDEKVPGLPGQPLEALDQLLEALIDKLNRLPFDSDLLLENELLRASLLGADPVKIAALALVSDDFSAALFQTTVSNLVLWGEQDSVTPLRTAHVLNTILPESRLQILPQIGHVPMLQQPEEFNLAIMNYLDTKHQPRADKKAPYSEAGYCEGDDGRIFEGSYPSLEVTNCRNVQLRNIRTNAVTIKNSTAVLENVQINGDSAGLSIQDSTIEASGLVIEADTALKVKRSRCDIAGADIFGTRAGIDADPSSTLLFSVSRLRTHNQKSYLHGLWQNTEISRRKN